MAYRPNYSRAGVERSFSEKSASRVQDSRSENIQELKQGFTHVSIIVNLEDMIWLKDYGSQKKMVA